jgi:hypothetical protein
MEKKIKRIPVKDEMNGRLMLGRIALAYGEDVASKIKIICEISFNEPIYDFGTDKIVGVCPELKNWYLEFPEEINITN